MDLLFNLDHTFPEPQLIFWGRQGAGWGRLEKKGDSILEKKGKDGVWLSSSLSCSAQCLAGSRCLMNVVRKSACQNTQQLVQWGGPAGQGTLKLHSLSLSSPDMCSVPVDVHIKAWLGHTAATFKGLTPLFRTRDGSSSSDRKPMVKFAWSLCMT